VTSEDERERLGPTGNKWGDLPEGAGPTYCVNDTDGDGNCAACARNPQAPCRVPRKSAPSNQTHAEWAREYWKRYDEASDERPAPTFPPAPDVFESGRRAGESRPQAKSRIYADFLKWATEKPVRRRLPEDVLEAGMYETYRLPEQYATMPKEYVQGYHGGGRPYNTHNAFHFTMRYGMGNQPPSWKRVWLGVFADTPRRMAEVEAQQRAVRGSLRLLSLGALGDTLSVSDRPRSEEARMSMSAQGDGEHQEVGVPGAENPEEPPMEGEPVEPPPAPEPPKPPADPEPPVDLPG